MGRSIPPASSRPEDHVAAKETLKRWLRSLPEEEAWDVVEDILGEPPRHYAEGVRQLVLVSCGDNGLKVASKVSALFDMGVKDSLDIVDAAPVRVGSPLDIETAEEYADSMKTAGAEIRLVRVMVPPEPPNI